MHHGVESASWLWPTDVAAAPDLLRIVAALVLAALLLSLIRYRLGPPRSLRLDIAMIWLVGVFAWILLPAWRPVLAAIPELSPSQAIWYCATALLVVIGSGLCVTPRYLSKYRLPALAVGLVFLGVGLGLGAHRYVEHRWPGDTATKLLLGSPGLTPATGQPSAVTTPTTQQLQPPQNGLSDTLAIVGLVLAVLTGVVVQYITSSMRQIQEQREAIDREFDLKENLDKVRLSVDDVEHNRERMKHYLYFNESYIEAAAGSAGSVVYDIGRDRLSNLRDVFRDYTLPKSTLAGQGDLADIFRGVRKLGESDGREHRQLLRREHIDYVRRLGERCWPANICRRANVRLLPDISKPSNTASTEIASLKLTPTAAGGCRRGGAGTSAAPGPRRPGPPRPRRCACATSNG